MDTTQISGWGVMALGMGIVFLGLVALIYISKLMSFLCRLAENRKAPAKAETAAPAAAAASAAPAPILNRPQFVAALSGVIAVHMGTEPDGLRIHSIRQVGAAGNNRGEFVAAVSAAIASEMGTDVAGIRIHSIRQA